MRVLSIFLRITWQTYQFYSRTTQFLRNLVYETERQNLRCSSSRSHVKELKIHIKSHSLSKVYNDTLQFLHRIYFKSESPSIWSRWLWRQCEIVWWWLQRSHGSILSEVLTGGDRIPRDFQKLYYKNTHVRAATRLMVDPVLDPVLSQFSATVDLILTRYQPPDFMFSPYYSPLSFASTIVPLAPGNTTLSPATLSIGSSQPGTK